MGGMSGLCSERRKTWQRIIAMQIIRDLRTDKVWLARDLAKFIAPYFGVTSADICGRSTWFIDADARHFTIVMALRLTRKSRSQISIALFDSYDGHRVQLAERKWDDVIDQVLAYFGKTAPRRHRRSTLLQELHANHKLVGDAGGRPAAASQPGPSRLTSEEAETARPTYHDEAA